MKLTNEEYREFRKLRPEEGLAVNFWRRVGIRLNFDFYPDTGPLPSVRVRRDGEISYYWVDREVQNPNVTYEEEEYEG